MELIIWQVILAPALQGLTAIALDSLKAIPGEIVGARADEAVCAGYKAFTNYLKQGGKPVNHDLQKAVRRSYLSALQSIASECHSELNREANYPAGYLLGHQSDMQWLKQKLKALEAELKKVDQAEYVETLVESFVEIELLLTPEGKLAEEQIQAVKQKLLDEALRDGSVPCYKAKLEHATEGLFERMCAYFASEIKNNQAVRAVFEGQLLAQINSNLQRQQCDIQVTIQNLEDSLRDVARDVPQVLEKLDKLGEAIQQSNYKLDQGFGDVLAVVTTSSADIQEIKGLLEQLVKGGNVSPLVELEQQAYENIPRSGVSSDRFVGRSDQLETLHQQLQQQERVAICAIAGMGGVGKTELAIQYARSHLQTYQGGICWLQVRSLNVETQIVNFARSQLNLTLPEDLDPPSQVAFCWQHWPSGEVLVVLDDVTDYKQVKPYLPPEASRFKVLITTRERLGPPLARLDLDVLAPGAALELLRSLVGTERIEQELAVSEKLCEWLGYLPLGLELVGRYLEQEADLSLEQMQQRLNRKRLRHRALDQADSTMTGQIGVADAFELSWERLAEDAQQLGCLLSLFALAPIPWSLVESVVPEQDLEDLELARATLIRLHLLQRTSEGTYRLHQLIREFLQEKLAQSAQADDLKQAFVAALVKVAQQIPDSPRRELIIAITPVVPHMAEVATDLTDLLSDADLIWPFVGLGRFYAGQGFYDQAQPWIEQCLSATLTRFGTVHLDVAISLNYLGYLYKSQRRYSEAESLYLQALELRKHLLELRKHLLGEEHLAVAASLNDLAGIYKSQGHYSKAEPLYLEALELYKHLLGEEHLAVSPILNNLAGLYNSQGHYSKAEPLYLQALELRRRLLPEDHPDVATILNNLAGLYKSQGRYSEAEPLYLEALELRKCLLPEDHPDVATSLDNLAGLYEFQRRYSEAEFLYLEALDLYKRLLGEEHLDVAASLNNLARFYNSQGRYSEAEPLYLQALELTRRLPGEEHPDVATSLNSLAGLYMSQGRYSEAEPLFLQALELTRRLLGEEHPHVAISLNNLALLYKSQGRYSEAEPLFLQALAIFERQLGTNHPHTITVRDNLEALHVALTSEQESRTEL